VTLWRDRDLLTALVLFLLGGISLSEAGSDVRNWIFPLLATYLILAIGAFLAFKVLVGAFLHRAPDAIEWGGDDAVVMVDLLVFGAIMLVYMFVMHGLGFWLASFGMLTLASIYMTSDKTPRNLMLAIAVPAIACVLAYLVFLHIFFVPLPGASWWPGFR
jgi:hypothetical protein